MSYAREMAHKAQDRWLNGPGGHAEALEAVEAVINEVIERCADVADAVAREQGAHWKAADQIAEHIRALKARP